MLYSGSPCSIPHEFSSARLSVNPVRFSAGSVPTSSGEVGSGTVRFGAGSVLGRFWVKSVRFWVGSLASTGTQVKPRQALNFAGRLGRISLDGT